MIRVNLARNMSSTLGGSADETTQDQSNIRNQGAIKLLLIFLGPILLFGYESQILPQKQADLVRLNMELGEVTAKNAAAADAVQQMQTLSKEKVSLQQQIDTLQKLRQERNLEVRVLEAIQRSLPDNIWFTQISANNSIFQIRGFADGGDVSKFMDALGKIVFVKDVTLVSEASDEANKTNRKAFDIKFVAESIK